MLIVYNIRAHGFYVFYIHMAVVVKRLTHRIVAPARVSSILTSHPTFFGLIGAPVHPYGEGIGKISVSGTRIDKKHINRIGIGTRSTP